MLMLLIAFQSTTISSKMADQPALLEAWSVADVASFLVLLANEAKLVDFHRASARCTANAIDGKTLRQLDLSADLGLGSKARRFYRSAVHRSDHSALYSWGDANVSRTAVHADSSKACERRGKAVSPAIAAT